MLTLLRYELKKLLSRRLVWLIVALCAAYVIFINRGYISHLMGGYVQGMKDVYAAYEGRVVTDAFRQEVKDAFEQYADDHPSHIQRREQPDGTVDIESTSMESDYYSGVCATYQEISFQTSVEGLIKMKQSAQKALTTGMDENGNPLLKFQRKEYEESIKAVPVTPVIRYAAGWDTQYFFFDFNATGPIMIGLLALIVLPLFGKERSSRLESILLCSPRRTPACIAKMLAAAVYAAALVVLFLGLELLISAITYGLEGAFAPSKIAPGLSNIASCLFGLLATMLAAAACASLIALATTLTRNTLLALLIAAILIAVQVLISRAIDDGVSAWLFRWIDDRTLEPPWYYEYQVHARMLPVNALLNNTVMGYGFNYMAFTLGLPIGLSALLIWLSPKLFLKRRKS